MAASHASPKVVHLPLNAYSQDISPWQDVDAGRVLRRSATATGGFQSRPPHTGNMDATSPDEIDVMIAKVWGRNALDGPPDPDPEMREPGTQALSIAIRLYLQSYLDDMRELGEVRAPAA